MMSKHRRSSLPDRCWECLLGFPSPAMEHRFVQQEIKNRSLAMIVFFVFAIITGLSKLFQVGWSDSPFWYILLEPYTPVIGVIQLTALATGRWRWMEPTALVGLLCRAVSVTMWITQDPETLPPVLLWWGTGPFSSHRMMLLWAVCTVAVTFLNPRFKYGALQSVFWAVIAPSVVHRSNADLHAWPLVLLPLASIIPRLVSELRGRAHFLSLCYPPPTMPRKLGNEPLPQSMPPIVREFGTKGLLEDPMVPDSLSPTMPLKLGNEPLPQAEMSDDEMSDQELVELIEDVYNNMYGLIVAPRQTNVYLRIPDADPDDLKPEDKERLQRGFEAQFPGYVVSDITFQRGSLLVEISVVDASDAESHGSRDSIVLLVQAVSPNTWLSWLGLPADMDMTIRVDIPTDRRVSLLDGFPLAVAVHKSDQDFCIVSFPLRCSDVPKDVAFKASLGCSVLACDVLVRSSDEDEPDSGPTGEQSCVTLQVKLPMEVLSSSPCWLLKVNVQSLSDCVIVGDQSVVLLLDPLTHMESELCSMRLLRPPTVAPTYARGQQFGADVAFALGCWLQTMHVEHQHRDNVHGAGEVVEKAPSKQLAGMWKAGNNLLTLLVGNGCNTIAQHVIHLLLSSAALHPCIKKSVCAESLECLVSFHDFFRGVGSPQGSSMLHLAVLSGSHAMVDEVLRWSHAYDLPCLWNAKDSFGLTPLHLAQLVNNGQMATYLLRKGDPVVLHAWQHNNGGRVGSPKQFGKRMVKLNATMERGGRDRSRLSSTAWQRGISMRGSMTHGQSTSEAAPAMAPAITPAHASPCEDDPGNRCSSSGAHCPVAHEDLIPGRDEVPSPLTPAANATSVVPDQPSGTAAPSFLTRLKQPWFSVNPFPDAQQERRLSIYRIEQRATTIRLARPVQMVLFAVLGIRGKGTLISLAMVALICCCQLPLHRSFAKRDHAAVEKQLFGFMLARSLIFLCGLPLVHKSAFTFWNRPLRPLFEPVRFRWVMAEMLFNLVGRCVACRVFWLPLQLHWWLLSYVCQILFDLFLRLHDCNLFLVANKKSS